PSYLNIEEEEIDGARLILVSADYVHLSFVNRICQETNLEIVLCISFIIYLLSTIFSPSPKLIHRSADDGVYSMILNPNQDPVCHGVSDVTCQTSYSRQAIRNSANRNDNCVNILFRRLVAFEKNQNHHLM